MLGYTARRLVATVPTLLFLSVCTFFLLRLAPGGPFDSEKVWPPEVQKNIEARYGLDDPLWMQYSRWLSKAATGDFSESFQYLGKPVSELIWESFPPSFYLGLGALILAIVSGIGLGALSAWKKGSPLDIASVFISIAGVSLPSFLVASILILVFSIWLGWLPPALWDGPSSLVLPIVALSLRPAAMIARLTRSSMIEVVREDYIRTAMAKGASTSSIIFKHSLKNAMIPVVTLLGPIAANLITGSFVVEMMFQLPGLGRYFVLAVLNRDYPVVMGVTMFYGTILILLNLFVDLAYGFLDPRIRLGGARTL